MRKRNLWLIIFLVLIAVTLLYAFGRRGSAAPQYFTADVERGDIRAQVDATGTINAVTSVQVGSQVSGTISQLNADFNSQVKKGQVIARIDPSIFEGNLLQARADYQNAVANLAAAKANLDKAKATAIQTKNDYQRSVGLAKEGVISTQQLDLAKSAADSAEAQVSASQAGVTQAQAQVQQKDAQVQVAKTNLDHTIITAPIDGTVIARSVDIGQTVAASLQAPTLFTIAQDLTKMLVYTKTDESDIGRIRPGQPVIFKVDAFPNETFRGRVKEVRMNATVVQNVVTYDTIIEFDNPDRKLFPGMTAYVTIPVAQADNVLRIPNGAIRFKPDMKPEEIRALYQKYGIQTGRQQNAEQAAANNAPATQPAAAASTDTKGGGTTERGNWQGKAGGGTRGNWLQRQGSNAADQNATPGAPPATRAQTAVVWKLLPDKSIQPVQIKTGITDFTVTELVSGELKEGDQLVTGSQSQRAGGASPFSPQRPGGAGGGGRGPR